MIALCPQNESIHFPWIDHGFNRCFLYTVESSIFAGISILPCFGQIIFYRKYGVQVDSLIISKSKLYFFQLALHILLAILSLCHAIVYEFMVAPVDEFGNATYGFAILQGILMPITWIFIFSTLITEHNKSLPSTPSRGHGLILLLCWLGNFILINLPLVSLDSPSWWWRLNKSSDYAEFSIWVIQYMCSLFVFLIGIKAPGLPNYALHYARLNAESGEAAPRENKYRLYWKRFKFLMPFIWPKSHFFLQMRVLFCALLLIAGRVANVYTPIFYKELVDSLTPNNASFTVQSGRVTIENWTPYQVIHNLCNSQITFQWKLILVYVGLRVLQGLGAMNSGIIAGLRSQCWIAIDQFSSRELAVVIFNHVHGLSLNWHLSRKTGELLRTVDRGTSSISNILNYFMFNILPTIADILIGVIYFMTAFNIWYGLIVFGTMFGYLAATIVISSWRTKFRNEMNKLSNEVQACAVDSLLNFETVKYYNAEQWEVRRYLEATNRYQHLDWIVQTSLNMLNSVQNLIVSTGLFVGTILCVKDVVDGRLKVGDFVLFCTYIIQLYLPLNLFGTYYRMLQMSFVDMNSMFDLFDEQPNIVDDPDAEPLYVNYSRVEFRNVSFSYNPEFVLYHVGQTGSGKSTILRLLFRFFEVDEGQILIDHQNIAKVTQESLRHAIGVVPQDTVLFNTDILSNIRYGRQTASDAEVKEAARMADIHDRIMEFPQQYQTVVGERGLKLSGGEKQRVAIARTILKAPKILLLDEATSALDSQTERHIQASLQKVSENKTTIIVAHRLSTIINCDTILVMHRGEIVERGNHETLLKLDGHYAKLWRQQSEQLDKGPLPLEEESSNGPESTSAGNSERV